MILNDAKGVFLEDQAVERLYFGKNLVWHSNEQSQVILLAELLARFGVEPAQGEHPAAGSLFHVSGESAVRADASKHPRCRAFMASVTYNAPIIRGLVQGRAVNDAFVDLIAPSHTAGAIRSKGTVDAQMQSKAGNRIAKAAYGSFKNNDLFLHLEVYGAGRCAKTVEDFAVSADMEGDMEGWIQALPNACQPEAIQMVCDGNMVAQAAAAIKSELEELPIEVIASGADGNISLWTLTSDGTLTISGEGETKNYALVSPPWYSYRESITKVVIEDGITRLGMYLCKGCVNLESVSLGKSVKSIEGTAFSGCRSLTDLYADPDSEYYLSVDGILYDKAGATLKKYPVGRTSYAIRDGVTSIAAYAFYNCYYLTNVTIPESVTTIERFAFYYNSYITSAIFAVTSGWTADDTAINEADLADPAVAAEYLTNNTYGPCTWTRT